MKYTACDCDFYVLKVLLLHIKGELTNYTTLSKDCHYKIERLLLLKWLKGPWDNGAFNSICSSV